MHFNIRLIGFSIFFFSLMFSATTFADAEKPKPQPLVHVPLVKCRNFAGNGGSPDGELPDTKEKSTIVHLDTAIAQKLAYYRSPNTGVLAPRGWYCIGYSGTGGGTLYVTPNRIKRGEDFDGKGQAVIVSLADASTSGRFSVADMIARFFPAYKRFVDKILEEKSLITASDLPSGPYPNDKLRYLNDNIVEIQTPSNLKGFGTESRFKKNVYPIYGLAILARPAEETAGFLNEDAGWEGTFALRLYIRLQPDKDGLVLPIMHQFEPAK